MNIIRRCVCLCVASLYHKAVSIIFRDFARIATGWKNRLRDRNPLIRANWKNFQFVLVVSLATIVVIPNEGTARQRTGTITTAENTGHRTEDETIGKPTEPSTTMAQRPIWQPSWPQSRPQVHSCTDSADRPQPRRLRRTRQGRV